MTVSNLKIVDNELCLVDQISDKVIKKHKPLSEILEFRKVKENTTIIRVHPDGDNNGKANIYCVDDDFNIRWFAERPWEQDVFPNPISWDKEINDTGKSWEDYLKDSPNSLTCSSWNCITVSIDYDTGKITKSLFTK
jgi:hypothetical protein